MRAEEARPARHERHAGPSGERARLRRARGFLGPACGFRRGFLCGAFLRRHKSREP